MVNPNFITREEAIRKFKAILGEHYTDWTHDIHYNLERIANDVIHLRADNQVWREKSQELESQLATNQQAHNHELRSQIQANQAKDETISQLETKLTNTLQSLQDLQQENQEKDQKINQLQTKLTSTENALNQIREQLNQAQELTNQLQQENQSLKEKLVEAQQKYQNHLTQEKTQLTQEIQLIKGVLT